jgi:predicted transcriptional regulator of viral defense system
MTTKENIQAISEIAASQTGLFTTAQAERFAVSRNVLAYMAKAGKIERLEHGVYRINGAPYSTEQGIYAVWLSTNPARMSYERYADFDGIVVGGRSAAALQGVGDFFLSPYRFLTHRRVNSKRQNIIFTKRFVERSDVVFTETGLPFTSITRTIFDLIVDSEEPSLLARMLSDALKSVRSFNADRLKALIEDSPVRNSSLSGIVIEEMSDVVKG